MNMHRVVLVASAAFFIASSASAQNAGSVMNHAFALGKGPGQSGYTSLLCGSAQLAVGQAAADPICRTVTGDVTIDATGATAIGALKVTAAMIASMTSAQLRTILSDETGTGAAYFAGGALGTPASGVLTNATGCPVSTCISGLAANIAAFLATSSSANLAAALTDETGTGFSVFSVSPALTGTPTAPTAAANTNTTQLATTAYVLGQASSTSPIVNGTAAAGSGLTFSRTDHVHPTDTSRAALASPTFTGTPAAPTPTTSPCDNSTKLATTAYVILCSGGGSGLTINGQTGAVKSYYAPQGRLTLATATPVMSSTVSGATTVYYTPYIGDMIPIYDGTNMAPMQFAELSVATTDTTKNPAAIGANKVNDWCVWNDSGTLRLSHGPDWTSDTAQAAGGTFARQNGIMLNVTAITNGPAASRCTWVGTTRSGGASAISWTMGGLANGGTAGFLGVWNAYNRVDVYAMTADSNTGYAYTTNSFRQANASAGMQISFVRGANEDLIRADYSCAGTGGIGAGGGCGVGLDNTTTATGIMGQMSNNGSGIDGVASFYIGQPSIGVHYIAALEKGAAGMTFYGLTGGFQTGLYVSLRM